MRAALIVLTVVASVAVAAVATGTRTWQRATAEAADRLVALAHVPPYADRDALAALPEPAARYLRRAAPGAGPRLRTVTLTQQAEFFINGAWRPLTATQRVTISPPGLVWDARIQMAPLLPVFVRDTYVDGRGSMQASIYGLYSLADAAASPALNAGALQRWLGEAVWFPTALLPSPTVRWSARDDRSALATITDRGASVALLFQFNSDGDVITISGDRFKEANGRFVLQPWVIACGEHAERGGMRIPLHCEVAWIGPHGPEPYWRGRVATIDYDVLP